MSGAAKLSRVWTLVHIEDDHAWGEIAQRVIGEQSDVRHCGQMFSGEEGIAHCRKIKPDIVLLDLGLPDGDGFAVADRLSEILPATSGAIGEPAFCCSPAGLMK